MKTPQFLVQIFGKLYLVPGEIDVIAPRILKMQLQHHLGARVGILCSHLASFKGRRGEGVRSINALDSETEDTVLVSKAGVN